MYCPRCSQQQVTDDASFCSRCGFQLGIVKELLVTDGALPARAVVSQSGFSSPGRRGARLGAKLIFFSLISLPLFIALSVNTDSPVPFWPPALLFLVGLTFVLYARIFREDILPSKRKAEPVLFERIAGTPPLPLLSGTPRSELGAARANTAEIIQPPSVTERTTNLL
jgi:hypothetical protein